LGFKSCGSIPAISTVLSKIAYFAIFGAITSLSAALFLAYPGILADMIGAENEIPPQAEKTKIASIKEGRVVLNNDSALIGTQPLTADAGKSGAADVPEDTQFAGEYGEEDLFYASCGMEVKAGFPGLVYDIGFPEKWNGGKGGYVTMQNAYTLGLVTYSHLSDVYVEPGDFLEKGEAMGVAGASGDLLPGGTCQIGVASK